MERRHEYAFGILGAAVGAIAVMAYLRRVEAWSRTWGATADEIAAALPIDDLVVAGAPATTRAITVRAPIEDVWEWLVQIGQDRAGFYSYTRLENLVGARMQNADAVHADWQQRARGDTIWLADPARWGTRGRQVVALVDPPRALVMTSPDDFDRLERGERAHAAWGFFLVPSGDRSTRFVVRSSGGPVGAHVFDGIHFLMEQRMMRGLRDRAEAATS
jgi:hypothetical protein